MFWWVSFKRCLQIEHVGPCLNSVCCWDVAWSLMLDEWCWLIFWCSKWNVWWYCSFELCLQIGHVEPFLRSVACCWKLIDVLCLPTDFHNLFNVLNMIYVHAVLSDDCLQIDHIGPFFDFSSCETCWLIFKNCRMILFDLLVSRLKCRLMLF